MDNSFDNIIEYDSGSSSDKENEVTVQLKQPKTSNDQFSRIAQFIREHDEKQIDKTTYDLLWDDLAAKLNDIGPPDHSPSEWRRIWSVHKYNNKRKRLAESVCVHSEDPQPSVHFDEITHSSKLDLLIERQSTLSQQMEVVIGNQLEMIANQQLLIDELKTSNMFLNELTKKS